MTHSSSDVRAGPAFFRVHGGQVPDKCFCVWSLFKSWPAKKRRCAAGFFGDRRPRQHADHEAALSGDLGEGVVPPKRPLPARANAAGRKGRGQKPVKTFCARRGAGGSQSNEGNAARRPPAAFQLRVLKGGRSGRASPSAEGACGEQGGPGRGQVSGGGPPGICPGMGDRGGMVALGWRALRARAGRREERTGFW
ncbi:hypothetical protein TRVL_09840 [Trypanosoma vivax]|nr:hypothetical protein TRVL_09840 [Trypanosoma vivax]